MMFGRGVNKDSKHIMHLIKPGTVGAEIGVWKGNTSSQFLWKAPKMLHLVDSWSLSGYDEAIAAGDKTHDHQHFLNKYQKVCGNRTFEQTYDDVYNEVVMRFGPYDNITIHRMTSTQWFQQYDEPFLDWIYIDGDHSFTGCYNDLRSALDVVKPGGMILGDDYGWERPNHKPGVRLAVDQFLHENKLCHKRFGEVQYCIDVPQ